MTTKYYKFLNNEGKSPHLHFPWSLPQEGKEGNWIKHEGKVDLGRQGLHACTLEQSRKWIDSNMFELEFKGKVKTGSDKVVGREARLIRRVDNWNIKTLRLILIDLLEESMVDEKNEEIADILGGQTVVSELIHTLRNKIEKGKPLKDILKLKFFKKKFINVSLPVSEFLQKQGEWKYQVEYKKLNHNIWVLGTWSNMINELELEMNSFQCHCYAFGSIKYLSGARFIQFCSKYNIE